MLKSFKTNFNKTNLLRKKYRFYLDFGNEQIIYFRFPTFGELYDKVEEIDATLYLMTANPKEFDKNEMGFIAENTYELFWGIIKYSPFYTEIITKFFNKFFESQFTCKDGMMKLDDVVIDREKFDTIVMMFLIATGNKSFSDWTDMFNSKKEEQLDELSNSILQKMAQNNAKIKKTKENRQNQKTTDLDIIMLSIVNEIQSISLDDIFDMNYFTFMWYYSNLNKLVENKIQIVAAGNGLVKNFNYLT